PEPPAAEIAAVAAVFHRGAGGELSLHDLRAYPGLHDRSSQRMQSQLLWSPDAEQVTGDAAVQQVELRGLHQTLAQVAMERGQAQCQVARLQHAHPALGRVVSDPGVAARHGGLQTTVNPIYN